VSPTRNTTTAATLVPPDPTLDSLRQAAAGCKACPLWEKGTQTVFGAGDAGAEVMLVGEQPGDKEDVVGLPFVGPAGRLLDEALVEAGIDRTKAYVTNAVKHFKWRPAGKVRLHQKPSASEVAACRPWLEAEIATVQPRVVVCLGATAAQSLFGSSFRVTKHRGEFIDWPYEPLATATVHPSSILRAPDEAARQLEYDAFVRDLNTVATALQH
jgi:uracil-DNA glycosylase family protein